jgi:hypothetical protein
MKRSVAKRLMAALPITQGAPRFAGFAGIGLISVFLVAGTGFEPVTFRL